MNTGTKITLLDVVALKRDSTGSKPDIALSAGQQGTIVEDFGGGKFLVELVDKLGVTIDLYGCTEEEVTLIWRAATGTYVEKSEDLIAA